MNLRALDPEQWESLCDRCGTCCEIKPTGVACPLFDVTTRRCTDYENRHDKIPACVRLTPDNVADLGEDGTLPASCAYLGGSAPHAKPLVAFADAPPEFQADVLEALRRRGSTL